MSEDEQLGFQLYRCKDCGEVVTDPSIHSKETDHYTGYIARMIPIEVEETKEQKTIKRQKSEAKKKDFRAAADKLVAERRI